MNKTVILLLITFIALIAYWAIVMLDFSNGVIEDIPKNQTVYVDHKEFRLADYPTSEAVEFTIESEEKNLEEEPIIIKMIWTNLSDKPEIIMIRDSWEHPMGVGASIKNDQGIELTEHSSRHFLSSQLIIGDELKDFELTIKPNHSFEKEVNILKIPHFKKDELNKNQRLPKGDYGIQLNYHEQLSNEVTIQII